MEHFYLFIGFFSCNNDYDEILIEFKPEQTAVPIKTLTFDSKYSTKISMQSFTLVEGITKVVHTFNLTTNSFRASNLFFVGCH